MEPQKKNEEPIKLLRLGSLLFWLLILRGLLICNGLNFWPKTPSQASMRLNRNFEPEKNYLIKHWDIASKNSDITIELSKLDVNEQYLRF